MPRPIKSRPSPLLKVQSDDYAIREYGVTEQQLDRFVKRTQKQIARARKAGTMKRYTGDLEADIAD
jgi:acetyl-CoA acetyltransferase